MGVTFSLPSRWGHVQGLRAHPSSSTCMTEACKRCGHPAGEESGTQVCLLGSSLFINSLLHMRRYWRNIAYILIYLRRGFSTSDRKIKWCMSSLRKGDSQPLGSACFLFFFFSVIENQMFVWKVLKSHLLKPEASFETLPAFSQSTYE